MINDRVSCRMGSSDFSSVNTTKTTIDSIRTTNIMWAEKRKHFKKRADDAKGEENCDNMIHPGQGTDKKIA